MHIKDLTRIIKDKWINDIGPPVVGVAMILFLVAGCQTASNVSTSIKSAIKDPAQVQAVITLAALNLKPHVAAGDAVVIHQFAVQLLALSVANVDPVSIDAIIPSTTNQYTTLLVNLAVVELNTYLKTFGAHNQQVVVYAQAIGHGLTNGGF